MTTVGANLGVLRGAARSARATVLFLTTAALGFPWTVSAAVKPGGVPSTGSPAVAVASAPEVAPLNIDFGQAWDGDLLHRVITLKSATADGTVTVSEPASPFHILELRVLGPPVTGPAAVAPANAIRGPGAQAPSNAVASPAGQVRAITTQNPGAGALNARNILALVVLSRVKAPPWQALVRAGQQVQVEVAFQPKFDFFSMPAGLKSSSVKLHGPGTMFAWTVPVALRGMFDGLRLGPALIVLDRDRIEPASRTSEEGFPVVVSRVRLVGTGQKVTGEFRVQDPKILVARAPVIDLGASETREVDVHLLGTIAPFTPTDVTVAFNFQRQDGTKGASTGGFSILTYPDSFSTAVSGPTLCGVGVEWWQPWEGGDSFMLTVWHDGHMDLSLPFWNRTLDTRNVKLSLTFPSVAGTFFNQTIAVKADAFTKPVVHDTFASSPGVPSKTYFDMRKSMPSLQCSQ